LLPDDTKSRFHGEHQELGTGTLRKGQEQRGFWYAEYRGMACVQSTKAEEVPLRWREATANNQQKKSSKAGTKEQEHQGSNLGSFVWSTKAKEESTRWREATNNNKQEMEQRKKEWFSQNWLNNKQQATNQTMAMVKQKKPQKKANSQSTIRSPKQ
jgi:hypothetical protein